MGPYETLRTLPRSTKSVKKKIVRPKASPARTVRNQVYINVLTGNAVNYFDKPAGARRYLRVWTSSLVDRTGTCDANTARRRRVCAARELDSTKTTAGGPGNDFSAWASYLENITTDVRRVIHTRGNYRVDHYNCGGALTQTQIFFVYSLVRGPLDVLEPTVLLFVQHVLILRLVRITENITHEYYYVGGFFFFLSKILIGIVHRCSCLSVTTKMWIVQTL